LKEILNIREELSRRKNMLTPIGKRLLIKPVEQKKGNIILTKTKPLQFIVIETGDEVTKIKRGDIIYLEKHHGAEIEHEREKFLVIEEGSILAKVRDSSLSNP
jgi:co-chaperonin GroES (HSP10)